MKCISNKKVYQTKEIAVDALIEAHMQFEYSKDNGPITVYQCEDCGYYHFTSKGVMNERLASLLKDGKIHRQREANQWINKMKNRH